MSAVKLKERKLKDERKQAKKDPIAAKEERKMRRHEVSSHMKLDQSADDKPGCSVPMISCYRKGDPVANDGIKMVCTNKNCEIAKKLVHPECFEGLENALLKILKTMGSARGWTDVQRRQNLWEKKGLNLIHKQIRCQCTLGIMCLDNDFKNIQKNKKADEIGVPQTEKRKSKKKNKDLPTLTFGKITATREEQVPINRKRVNELENHYLSYQSHDESMDETYFEEPSLSIHPTLLPKRSSQLSLVTSTPYGKPPDSIWPKLVNHNRYIVPSDNVTPIHPMLVQKSRMKSFDVENPSIALLQRNRTTSLDRLRTSFVSPTNDHAEDSAFESPGAQWTTPNSTRETSPKNEPCEVVKKFAEKVAAAISQGNGNNTPIDNSTVKNNNVSFGSNALILNEKLDAFEHVVPGLTSSSLSRLSTQKTEIPEKLQAENLYADSKVCKEASSQRSFFPGLLVEKNQPSATVTATAKSPKLKLLYTLFGSNSPNFLLGERLLANLHFPGKVPFRQLQRLSEK
uniref:Headcase N-terminal domain-containing protein n=1 Tax=Acrobeloides nanus TaxID=290746 RepID=A0A914DVM7_9BILA